MRHSYLGRYGYFPNEALQRQYPTWEPLGAGAPAFDDVFDEQTESAVLALQRQLGLATTGYVDEATRALLHSARCGVPDGIREPDPTALVDKFSLNGSVHTTLPITWRLSNTGPGVTIDQARSAIASALSRWSAETHLSFSQITSGTPRMPLSFGPVGGDAYAAALPPADGSVVIFSNAHTWSAASVTPPGLIDLQSVALHESGHALGLGHSSNEYAVMYPAIGPGQMKRHTLHDDNTAISTLYDRWALRPGAARDIAVGGEGSVWAVGNATEQNGLTVHRWNGTDFTYVPSNGAMRITVNASGMPWYVSFTGQIFRRRPNNTWQSIPDCATDIAAGVDQNDVWAIRCGTGAVLKWNEATFSWITTDGIGSRIAVTKAGIPWVVQTNGNIFERSTKNATGGTWIPWAGCAKDIGALNAVWAISCAPTAGGFGIAVWNFQNEVRNAKGEVASPARREWRFVPGGATNIAVGPFGPWAINNNLQIFQQDKPGTTGH